jgi:hypothetical protein
MSDDDRLERVERKIDELTKVVIDLARMEERMITLFNRMESFEADARDTLKRLTVLERSSSNRGIFFQALDKFVWLVLGAAATYVLYLLQKA